MNIFKNFTVLGGGSWGTALACHIANILGSSTLYVRNKKIAEEINIYHRNSKYLQDTPLHKGIVAICNLHQLKEADVIVIATPSYTFTDTLKIILSLDIHKDIPLLIATKGIASEPIQLFSEKIKATLDNPFAFISGPNFAKEVVKQKFTAITISSENMELASKFKSILASDNFQISTCDDIITIQVAGIVKNIIAIKSGILEASGQGENARAWLITKGLQEIALISKTLGGKEKTLLEPAVVGDLILTGCSTTSRNTKFGYEFCKNNYSKKFLENYPILVEGVVAAKLIDKLIAQYKLDLPIISSVVKLVIQ